MHADVSHAFGLGEVCVGTYLCDIGGILCGDTKFLCDIGGILCGDTKFLCNIGEILCGDIKFKLDPYQKVIL